MIYENNDFNMLMKSSTQEVGSLSNDSDFIKSRFLSRAFATKIIVELSEDFEILQNLVNFYEYLDTEIL